ncbi:metalloregulator ArsR/SmtB family transcription factor [Amycolatopsis acidiphila]|uniref:Helix-turn-helix transcriptional regulator n=1 Tax=Amycolatopsis acidiphila TaxID=715473 RepID=A0A558A5H5_9PSEU|nr:metalloregulator ArsR/SmtB family transcription factor [Amycolatopsis acidiphila]TVT19521.1 helix-turn-helix transcriptional regulator [Amycolatopsis acidiphila]UIJ56887.1 metalloregulator ArsR/SmtB family transcription factor [Amycolatopsis acidiphila]GHG54552.1 transcriptional regulator [Amycolatopsis acidiphila]
MSPGWTSAEQPVVATVTGLARELADPIRLTVLQLLAHEGPHGMTQLADILGVSPARLGNHLAKLRTAGLVVGEQSGRHVTYRLKDPAVTAVLDVLADYAGGALPLPSATAAPERLCYDHAAGRLGVALLDQLLADRALRRPAGGGDALELGPAAGKVLPRFGIDVGALAATRRKVATSCVDRTLRRPHLGGALGHEILTWFRAEDLVAVAVDDDGRTLTLRPGGTARLAELIPRLGEVRS